MSAHNPVMRPPPTPEGKLWISEEPAACLMDLANALYNHCLRCVSLAYAGMGRATQSILVSGAVDLMHLLTPVASALGTLPANPAKPNVTAGMSFATIRSSAALLAEVVSLDILVERLRQISEHCARLAAAHPDVGGLLIATGSGTQRLANRLTAHADQARAEGVVPEADKARPDVAPSTNAPTQ